MASDTIRIMISSRSGSPVFAPPVPLRVLRESLKTFIEEDDVVRRAASRKGILRAIAKEI